MSVAPEPEKPDPPPEPAPTSTPVKPGLARTRLPFESDERIKRQHAGKAAMLLYASGAIGLAGLAAYMATVGNFKLDDYRVWAPALVAVWFVVRAVMVAAQRDGD